MPLQIIHQDITKVSCDVIVNPTDYIFSGSGGTDKAIHAAAGTELDLACKNLGSLDLGEAAVTPAFRLPAKYIIHTVGPKWKDGYSNESVLLRSCYVNALVKAKRLGAASIAFPLISAGTFGFPKDKVMRIATDAISDFLLTVDSEMTVYICVIDKYAYTTGMDDALRSYLGGRFIPEEKDRSILLRREAEYRSPQANRYNDIRFDICLEDDSDGSIPEALEDMEEPPIPAMEQCREPQAADRPSMAGAPAPAAKSKKLRIGAKTPETGAKLSAETKKLSLSDWLKKQDDSFAVLLLKLIDQKGMGDVECYKKANVSKNTFWKINNDAKYRPSKPTVIAFAIALELTLDETEMLLRSAGHALSRNNAFDLIIEFYITNGVYDIFEINAALYQYDQQILGC